MNRSMTRMTLLAAIPASLATLACTVAFAQTAPARLPAASLASPPAEYVGDYVIGAHDLLEITVFDMEELNSEKRVTEEGTITLPLLGELHVGGLSPHQAEQAIAQELRDRKLVKNPQVGVFVKEYVSRRVYVQGAVTKPGPYPLLGQRTLLDMIGEAGGIDLRAGRKIYIIRGLDPEGTEGRIEIDVDGLIYTGDPLLNVILRPGDVVMVPYEKRIRIYVTGAVRNPNAHEFSADERVTILQAITMAGGTTDRANESKVKVLRKLPDGSEQQINVNLRRIMKGREPDLELQANDIVIVEESFF